jgi:GTPase SAR1 family protein
VESALTAVLKKTVDVRESALSGITVALVGRSGFGKTSLMSKLALSHVDDTDIPTIIRFCGTSKFTYDGLKLIQSISVQILAIYKKQDELEKLLTVIPSQDYKTAVECFQNLMSEYPVNLLIDSLDQLENRYEEEANLPFFVILSHMSSLRLL